MLNYLNMIGDDIENSTKKLDQKSNENSENQIYII